MASSSDCELEYCSRGVRPSAQSCVAVNYEGFAGQTDLTPEERPCPLSAASHVLITTAAGEHDFSRLSRHVFSPAALRALPQSCAFAAAAMRRSSRSSSTTSSDDESTSSASSQQSSKDSESHVQRASSGSFSSNHTLQATDEAAAEQPFPSCCFEASTLNLAASEMSTTPPATVVTEETSAARATEAGAAAAATAAATAAAPRAAEHAFSISTGACGCGFSDWGEALLFEYRHIRYLLSSSEEDAFHPVWFDVSLPPPVLLHAVQQHAGCPWLLRRRQELYGPSNLHVECRSLCSLFAAEVLQPFYLCQIFAILLWLADEYYCYAIVISIITGAATVADVLSTRSRMLQLKKATETISSVTVLRRPSCSGCGCCCEYSSSSCSCNSGACLERKAVSSDDLTNGDLLLLQPGMRVPCDLLLLHGTVVLDERSLTGECFPVLKSSLPISYKSTKHISLEQARRHWPSLHSLSRESRHMVFAGTLVLSSTGSGEAEGLGEGCSSLAFGVVCRVGFATAQGATLRSLIFPSPLRMDFDSESLSFLLCLAGLTVIAAAYSASLFYSRGVPLERSIIRIADLFTDALPPALRATLSVSLTAAAARIFSLYGISSISPSRLNICGFVRCVCLDKTGTLTEDGVSLIGCLPICHCSDGKNISSIPEWALDDGAVGAGSSGNRSNNAAATEATSCFATSLVSPAMLRSRSCNYHAYCSCRVHMLQCMSCCSSLASVKGRVAGDPLEACLLAASGWRLLDAAAAADASATAVDAEGPSPADEYEMLRQRVGGAAAADGPTFFIPQQQTDDDRMLTHNTEGCICVARRYPFCSVAMRMSVVAISVHSKQTQIYSKGSPESVLPLCDKKTIPPGTEKRVTAFAAAGYRVLVAAWRPLDQGEDWQTLRRCRAERGLRYLGLFVFENKLKCDAKDTVRALRDAQIDIRILTGDSPHTAIGVAADCGVLDSKNDSEAGCSCVSCCCTASSGGPGREMFVLEEEAGNCNTPSQELHQHVHSEELTHSLRRLLQQRQGGETLRIPPGKRALILGEVCSRHEESVGRREFLVWSLLLVSRGSPNQQQQGEEGVAAGGMQPLLSLDIRALLYLLPDARQAVLVLTGKATNHANCRAFRHLSRLHVLLGLPFTERCDEIVQQVLARHQHELHSLHPSQLFEQQQQQEQREDVERLFASADSSEATPRVLIHPAADSSASVSSQLLGTNNQQVEAQQRRPSAHVEKLRDVVEDLLFQTPLLQPQQAELKTSDAEGVDGLLAHLQISGQEHSRPICSPDALPCSAIENEALLQQQHEEEEELLKQEAAEAVQQHLGELQQHHPGELLLPDAAARASLSRVDRIQELLHHPGLRRAEVSDLGEAAQEASAGAEDNFACSSETLSPRNRDGLRTSPLLQRFFGRRILSRVNLSQTRSSCCSLTPSPPAVAASQPTSNSSSRWSLKRLSDAARRLGLSRESTLPNPEGLNEPLLQSQTHEPSFPRQPFQELQDRRQHHIWQEHHHKRTSPERAGVPPFAAESLDALMHQEHCVGALGGMVLTFALRRCCCRCCQDTAAASPATGSTSPSQHKRLDCTHQHLQQQGHSKCTGGVSQHFKMSLYEFVLRRTALLCRANPQDKGDFISALQQLPSSPFVAMAGDGTNDLLAIKRADMGVSLSDDGSSSPTQPRDANSRKLPQASEGTQGPPGASLASSFTIRNLSSCVALLREGRCVLQNSISTVLFITLYSIIELSSVVCLYRLAGNLTDSQYMWVDLLTIMPLSLFLSQTEAPKQLSIAVPPSSLFARPVLFILPASPFAQAVIQVSFQIVAFVLCTAQPSVYPSKGASAVRLSGEENTSMFLISALQYIYVCAAVGCSGLQWRESLLKNRRCVVYMCLLWGLCLSFLLCPPVSQQRSELPYEAVLSAADSGGSNQFSSLVLRLLSAFWGALILLRTALYSWLGLVPLRRQLRVQLLLLSAANCVLTVAFEVFGVRKELAAYLKNRDEGGDSASHIPKTKGACQVTLLSPREAHLHPASSSPSTAHSSSIPSPPL
ncbi:hypothetical protein Efla_003321 [Eimeria flavescens]